MKDQFYITLPSNSSEKYYGKQPMHNYKTMLSMPLKLNPQEWEVGLAELIFPHSWKNITVGKFRMKMLKDNKWSNEEVEIPEALYSSQQQLVDTLNEYKSYVLGPEQKSRILFTYNPILNKMVTFVSEGYEVIFSKEQSVILGFGDQPTKLWNRPGEKDRAGRGRAIFGGEKIIPPFIFDLNRGLHTFFVYTDIIEDQLVGDSNVKLLRTVPVAGKSGDIVAQAFTNIHYVGLNRSSFQEIEIQITDDVGRKVHFAHGRVTVKLHFRRK